MALGKTCWVLPLEFCNVRRRRAGEIIASVMEREHRGEPVMSDTAYEQLHTQ